MALTKVSRGLLSTGIVDNSNAMAITIDSSENIGLGLVPTNFANRTSLDIGLGGKIWGHAAATETGHGSNFYFDGAYKRIAAVAPTRHVQDGNGHTFSVAASGAADSTITWDDALIVSTSSKVGIGTTTFPQDFTVLGNFENAGFYRDFTGAGIAANYVNIGRKDTNGSLVSGVRISGGGDDAVAASHNGYFEIATRKAGSFVPLLSSYSGGSDLVVNDGGIDMDFRVESDNSTHALFVQGSSSNVGIGISSPVSRLSVIDTATASKQIVFSNNTTYYGSVGHNAGTGYNEYRTESGGNHGFYRGTSATPDLRIDSAGNILSQYGDTAGYSTTSGNGGLAYVNDTGSSGGGLIISMDSDNGWSPIYLNRFEWSTGKDNRMIQFGINSTGDIGYISYDGANFAITNVSDYRLKENIVSYTGGLAKINAISVKSFNKIEGVSSHITQEGFIAHELQEVIPLAVSGEKDAMTTNEDGETVPDYQTVSKEILIPYLVSAIQEQQATIEALTQRLTALEDN